MDSATKERIIGHMNRDHQLALVDYTVVYGKQPLASFRPSSVVISDINTKSVTLRFEQANGTIKTVEVEFEKAVEADNLTVSSSADIKGKLIAMAEYAAKKQGFSHKQVKTVAKPRSGISYTMYALAVVLSATYVKPSLVRNVLSSIGLQNSTLLAKWAFVERNISPIFLGTYLIHIMEIVFVMLPKARKYRMPRETAMAWVGMNFIEGFLAFIRLNKVVKSI
ncbi:hypothetical protein PUMCH_003317 [Australozyma saopauloensis]|uniref:DUF2470 domain-containing protein n=1 Tax=Australozyma saopauloensis TaxID=291208 RepID=A0AAX4HBS3_9ASCO|nr:hypothetical protein PUMCH_003317 [[Candida] saopauloensis]